LRIFSLSGWKIPVTFKSDKNNGVLYTKTSIHFFIISRSFLLRTRNFQK